MKRPDPAQYDLLDWIDARVAAERPIWTQDTAISAFKTLLAEFHDTAVVGDRRAQDDVIYRINGFVHQVFDDSRHWRLYQPFAHNYNVRLWMLSHINNEDRSLSRQYLLGEKFAAYAKVEGEQVMVHCPGLSATRVTLIHYPRPTRHYWAGLGITGFHALQGRTPLEYILSRCTPDRIAP
ncbi:MAG TPA: hypothetical protein VIL88_02495 [Devosia sp.]|jgi:hypothetical protein|uniref:hypothetical protein n=1 Tax=Devosia sp. TaxID=1871048 RepID=UPI002F937DBC